MIGLRSGSGVSANSVCMIKNHLCDFISEENLHQDIVSCAYGPVLPDWNINHFSNRQEITNKSNKTCKSISNTDNFNLKIHWPTFGDNKSNFDLLRYGKNLKNCINLNDGLIESGITVYASYEYDNSIMFLGNFKACHLLSGDGL